MSLSSRFYPLSLLLTLLWFTSLAHGQDISGTYNLTVAQDPGADDCTWAGSLTLVQSGGNPGTFSGVGDVEVTAGPCFDFNGAITGNISGTSLTIGVGTGGLGSVDFTGSVTGSGMIGGVWNGLGLSGTWSATEVASVPAEPVPALPAALLALLSLLTAGFAMRFGFRRSR
ncbi:MAG: hypothetical protein AAF098_08115 [Pseudomonadota bacterium]